MKGIWKVIFLCVVVSLFAGNVLAAESNATKEDEEEEDADSTPPGGWKANKVALTPELQGAIENAVKNRLIDPESARFRNIRVYKDAGNVLMACGEVNPKNRMGGYSGYEEYSILIVGQIMVADRSIKEKLLYVIDSVINKEWSLSLFDSIESKELITIYKNAKSELRVFFKDDLGSEFYKFAPFCTLDNK